MEGTYTEGRLTMGRNSKSDDANSSATATVEAIRSLLRMLASSGFAPIRIPRKGSVPSAGDSPPKSNHG